MWHSLIHFTILSQKICLQPLTTTRVYKNQQAASEKTKDGFAWNVDLYIVSSRQWVELLNSWMLLSATYWHNIIKTGKDYDPV
jgi:hypothetical protein